VAKAEKLRLALLALSCVKFRNQCAIKAFGKARTLCRYGVTLALAAHRENSYTHPMTSMRSHPDSCSHIWRFQEAG
jgi:hypothetical protein